MAAETSPGCRMEVWGGMRGSTGSVRAGTRLRDAPREHGGSGQKHRTAQGGFWQWAQKWFWLGIQELFWLWGSEMVLAEWSTNGLRPVTAPDVLPQPQPYVGSEWHLELLQGGQDAPLSPVPPLQLPSLFLTGA